MKERKNTNLGIIVPKYASFSVYSRFCHLKVTLNIKEDLIPYINIKENGVWNTETFRYKGRWYITAYISRPITTVLNTYPDLQQFVTKCSRAMCDDLRVIHKKAQIAKIQNDITQLILF